MVKLIVLDWDDCIVQGSSEGYYACYADAIRENAIEVDSGTLIRQVRALWGRPHRDVIASIIGATHPQLDSVVHAYEGLIFTDTFSRNLSLVPGSKEALLVLKKNYALAVATGIPGHLLREHLLPRFGMQNIFSSIISSSELPDSARGKPYPDMLLRLLEKFAVLPSEALMVGDAQGDVLMAQAAGVPAVVVLTGQLTREGAEALGVQLVITSVSALPSVMENFKKDFNSTLYNGVLP